MPAQFSNIDFIRHRRAALVATIVLTAVSLVSLFARGLNFGIDFTGGVILEVSYDRSADLGAVRSVLSSAGLESAQVQSFGSLGDLLIRLPPPEQIDSTQTLAQEVLTLLKEQDTSAQLLRVESVGAQVGDELTEQGGVAVLFALVMIFVYVMLRFRWKFALGAIVATMHDIVVTIGFFSVFKIQFDLVVLGSVLAVLGYSLNDTIVVYDRIRDNFRLMRRSGTHAILNASINQTLSRTVITSFTTLLVVVAMLLLGGESLRGFSIALIVGIVVGTYSSIYVATSMALWLKIAPSDFIPPSRESIDELP